MYVIGVLFCDCCVVYFIVFVVSLFVLMFGIDDDVLLVCVMY